MTEIETPELLASPPLDTPWVPLWPLAPQRLGELAYAERTSDFNISTTEGVIVTAPAVTTDGNTPLVIEFGAAGWGCSAAAQAYAVLYEDGVNLGILTTTSETGWKPCAGMRRRTPAAGSHVYQMRASMGSGTGIIVAGAGGPAVNTPAFIRVSLAAPLLSAPPGAAVPVQYGTSLPTTPLDGQEAILVDSLTAPSYHWRFRYNAGGGARKWEYVGGAPAYVLGLADPGLMTNTTPQLVATPAFVIPRAGDFLIEHGAWMQSFAATQFDMFIDVTDGTNGSQTPLRFTPVANFNGAHVMYIESRSLAAGVTLQMRHWGSSANQRQLAPRWIKVTPLRVS